jgi:iodotyrosine deiodinase
MQSPRPLDSLGEVLGQPTDEKPFLVLPVGFPREDGEVPDIKKKLPQRTSIFLE